MLSRNGQDGEREEDPIARLLSHRHIALRNAKAIVRSQPAAWSHTACKNHNVRPKTTTQQRVVEARRIGKKGHRATESRKLCK